MSNPSHSPKTSLDADIPCLRCGYNLRALARDGTCPECGLPIGETLTIRGLGGDSGTWRDLRSSANGLAWLPLILVGVMALSFVALAGSSQSAVIAAVVTLLVGAVPLLASWLGFVGATAEILRIRTVRFVPSLIAFAGLVLVALATTVTHLVGAGLPVLPLGVVLFLVVPIAWTGGQSLRLLLALGEERVLLARLALWTQRLFVVAMVAVFVMQVRGLIISSAVSGRLLVAAMLLCAVLLAVLQLALMLRIQAVSSRVLAIAQAVEKAPRT